MKLPRLTRIRTLMLAIAIIALLCATVQHHYRPREGLWLWLGPFQWALIWGLPPRGHVYALSGIDLRWFGGR